MTLWCVIRRPGCRKPAGGALPKKELTVRRLFSPIDELDFAPAIESANLIALIALIALIELIARIETIKISLSSQKQISRSAKKYLLPVASSARLARK